MKDPLEHLTEVASEFQISYQRFKETGARYWTVKILAHDAPPQGTGDTLSDAIEDMETKRELEAFRQQLQHAALGNKSVSDWKAKLKELL